MILKIDKLEVNQMATKQEKRKYEKYEQLEHVKHRPDTYIGSTKSQTFFNLYIGQFEEGKPNLKRREAVSLIPGMSRIFVEILSNALDNIYRSQEDGIPMSKIRVEIDPETGETSIFNDGSWIPVEIHEETKSYIPKLIFGELLTSSNYDDSQIRGGSGRNGYGAKLTNIFSTSFKIEIMSPADEGFYCYRQEWQNNMTECGKHRISKRKTGVSSTKITWVPDFDCFDCEGYTEDTLGEYYRFVFDAAMIAGGHGVGVFLNGKKLPISGLRDYAKLFGNSKEILEISTKDSSVVLIPASSFDFVAFTNGVYNSEGGVHVDKWASAIFRPLLPKFNKKSRPNVSVRDIRQFFRLFVKCDLPNPEFNSQSKTYLTSPTPTVKVDKKHIDSLMKWEFVEKVRDIIHAKELLSLKKSERRKKVFKKIPGYDPANNAGGKRFAECVLIFTEGLSAKTYAVRGIQKGVFNERGKITHKGRDWFGVFPLRGKLLNVRNARTTSIAKNTEITNIICALGLRYGVDYTEAKNFDQLNYGRIIILCDADVDGIHIQGLLMNFFHSLFPSLLHRPESFITSMETPIVRVFEGGITPHFL